MSKTAVFPFLLPFLFFLTNDLRNQTTRTVTENIEKSANRQSERKTLQRNVTYNFGTIRPEKKDTKRGPAFQRTTKESD